MTRMSPHRYTVGVLPSPWSEVRKEMAPFYQTLGGAKDTPSLLAPFDELFVQHESDIIGLDLLETAILQNDSQYQLLLRIEDMKRRKQAVIAKATGDDQRSN